MYGEHWFAGAGGNSRKSRSGYGPRDTGFGERGGSGTDCVYRRDPMRQAGKVDERHSLAHVLDSTQRHHKS